MAMPRVIGIAGSLRKGSYNRSLLRAAVELAPNGMTVESGSIEGIPLYDGDVEKESGIPEAVSRLKDRIAAAHGLLLVTPEYNNSIPGVFKNALDWLTRPPKDIPRVFHDKPVALMGATPGQGGTRYAQLAWLPIFRALNMRPFFGEQLFVAGAGKVFDETGKLVAPEVRERLQALLSGFADFIGP